MLKQFERFAEIFDENFVDCAEMAFNNDEFTLANFVPFALEMASGPRWEIKWDIKGVICEIEDRKENDDLESLLKVSMEKANYILLEKETLNDDVDALLKALSRL